MIVLDATAAATFIAEVGAQAVAVRERVARERQRCAPHLIDPEVSRALRRLARSGEIEESQVPQMLDEFARFRMRRYPHLPFAHRVWALRENVAAYDAFYVALAEALDCPLVTTDGPLSRSTGHQATVELIA